MISLNVLLLWMFIIIQLLIILHLIYVFRLIMKFSKLIENIEKKFKLLKDFIKRD